MKFNVAGAVATVFCFLALTVAAFGILFLDHKIDTANASGWLQTIGGLISILAVLGIGMHQVDRAKDQAEAADRIVVQRRRDALRAILDDAASQCFAIRHEFEEDPDIFNIFSFKMSFDKRAFNGVIETIERIPLHELGSYQIAKSVSGIRNALIGIASTIEFALDPARSNAPIDGGTPDYQIKRHGLKLIEEVEEHYRLALKELVVAK